MHIPNSKTEPGQELTQQWGAPRHPQNGSGLGQEPSMPWTMSAHTSNLPSLTKARVTIPRDHLKCGITGNREQKARRALGARKRRRKRVKRGESEKEIIPNTEEYHSSAGTEEQEGSKARQLQGGTRAQDSAAPA